MDAAFQTKFTGKDKIIPLFGLAIFSYDAILTGERKQKGDTDHETVADGGVRKMPGQIPQPV